MKTLLVVVSLFLACIVPLQATACTLFAATGQDYVEQGGSLLIKVRDFRPYHQKGAMMIPVSGYRYYGLFSGKYYSFLAAGVNEKGLVACTSTAGSVPKAQRGIFSWYHRAGKPDALEYILRFCASVDQVLRIKTQIYNHPVNLMVADKDKIAYLEILPTGQQAVKVVTSGTLAHTNHYLLPESLAYNTKIGTSSAHRYARITDLLSHSDRPFTLDDFIAFSEDKNEGPDNSIYREGKDLDKSVQTVAVFGVRLQENGKVILYLKCRRSPQDKGVEEILEPTELNFY
ncbi:MAG: carcinine hydrolase/isopenicillin-N N-acyltransferase family protein [Acidaminococcaceae bacterium]|nr:carcinine hydrolase/isopenicillin-N N-acyltransferase family protein [Acidaminococcaceae bacterium]